MLRALGETESCGQSVGNCEGENTRPRVFRAAPTLPGGWKQGSVLRWDLTSGHPAVSGRVSGGGAGNGTRWRVRSPRMLLAQLFPTTFRYTPMRLAIYKNLAIAV